MIDQFLLEHLDKVKIACKECNVSKLYAFGSIVDGRFVKGKSDVDLLVEFDRKMMSNHEISKALLKLWIRLQGILNCKVDLITSNNIKGHYFKKYLNLYKELIYDEVDIKLS